MLYLFIYLNKIWSIKYNVTHIVFTSCDLLTFHENISMIVETFSFVSVFRRHRNRNSGENSEDLPVYLYRRTTIILLSLSVSTSDDCGDMVVFVDTAIVKSTVTKTHVGPTDRMIIITHPSIVSPRPPSDTSPTDILFYPPS